MSSEISESGAFEVRQSPLPEADLALDGDTSLVQLHQELVAGLEEEIVGALRECPGEGRREIRDELLKAGVGALDGRLAGSLSRLAHATNPEVDVASRHVYRASFDLLKRLGSGQVLGLESTLDDIRAALPPLLAATTAPEATPTVTVRLGVGWPSRRKQQRSTVLQFLADLAMGAEVRLVVSDAASQCILNEHMADLPTNVLTNLRNRRHSQRVHVLETEDQARVDDALDSLSRDARPAGILRALARSPTDSLGYDDLVRDLPIDGVPYESLRRLDDRELVERTESADGRTVVSLRPAGREVAGVLLTEQRRESGRSSAATSRSWSASSRSEPGDSQPPQISPAMPCLPAAWESPPGPQGGPDAAADERPQEDAETAADEDRTDRWQHGLVWPRFADRAEWVPAVESVDVGEVALVDGKICTQLDEDRDGRQPHVAYVDDEDTIHVGAEYHNPMQFAVALSSALLSERLLSRDDWADRIGEDLRGLDIHERPVLWSARCMGWLPSEVGDGADYLDELREARDDLREMSGLANKDESAVSRSSTTAVALGFIGTMIALFALLGVDVVLEARIPECSRYFGAEGNGDRRNDLVQHLGMLSALSSRVGAFSAFRQLFEDRPEKVSDGFSPEFTSGEAARRGSMNAGIVVVGDGVDGLADDLTAAVESPRPVRDDAPPIGVDVKVVQEVDQARTAATVRRMLRAKGICSTRAAESVVSGFTRSPWAAAEAIDRGLGREGTRREVYLDEVRRALATLGRDQLLPDETPAARDGVVELLAADEPISQAELARRAGFSTQTWRNNRESLITADIVRETAQGWRIALPFRDERGEDVDVADPPWYLKTESSRPLDNYDARKATDVLNWLVVDRGQADPSEMFDEETALGKAFEVVDYHGARFPRGAVEPDVVEDLLRDWGLPPDLLLAGCGGTPRPPSMATARMGESTRETTLI